MKYISFIYLLIFTSVQAFAHDDDGGKQRRNAVTVGFTAGPAVISTERSSNVPLYGNYYHNSSTSVDESSFCIGFTAEEYFNRAHTRLYFSLGQRLNTTYFQTSHDIYYAYPGYYGYQDNDHMLIGSLGVSAGLNCDIVRGKKAALTAQLAAVPMFEAGNFKDNYQPNAAGELYLGGTFIKKISVGIRASHRFMSYEYNYGPYMSDRYRVTQINFDVRFRINGGGNGSGGGMHHTRH
jgi:hypothetical protein